MTMHEPECHGCDCEKPYSCTHPWCLCDELRAAYQRGQMKEREAASIRVASLPYWEVPEVADDLELIVREEAIAAVRGDESIWEEVDALPPWKENFGDGEQE